MIDRAFEAYGLKVDHIGDIVWLPPEDGGLSRGWRAKASQKGEVNGSREEGNAAMEPGKTREANQTVSFRYIIARTTADRQANTYTLTLQSSPTDERKSRSIALNRSQAHLKLRHYNEAIQNTGELTPEMQISEKDFHHISRSLHEPRKFKECQNALDLLLVLKDFPSSTTAKRETNRINKKHSDYDFKIMYNAPRHILPCLDNAISARPAIEVRTSKAIDKAFAPPKI